MRKDFKWQSKKDANFSINSMSTLQLFNKWQGRGAHDRLNKVEDSLGFQMEPFYWLNEASLALYCQLQVAVLALVLCYALS